MGKVLDYCGLYFVWLVTVKETGCCPGHTILFGLYFH